MNRHAQIEKTLNGHRTVRESLRALRGLVGPKGDRAPILAACSGGADSSALVLALSCWRGPVTVAHVVHDLREREQVLADRDAVAALARKCDFELQVREIRVGHAGNVEGEARRLRYDALCAMAQDARIAHVATGHHADDQLETILMALVRGAGPDGMRGVAPSRKQGEVTIVRPMLGVSHEACAELCTDAGWEWREDATNQNTQRTRSFVRHEIMPRLESLRPGVAVRAGRTSRLMRDAAELIDAQAEFLVASGVRSESEICWNRSDLAGEHEVVVCAAIRAGAVEIAGLAGMDTLGGKFLDPLLRAIGDGSTEPRDFAAGSITARVEASRVTLGIRMERQR